MKHGLHSERGIPAESWRTNRNAIDLFWHSANIYWSTNCTRVGAVCWTPEGWGSLAREHARVEEWHGRWAAGLLIGRAPQQGREGHEGEWQLCLLLTGLFTIEYPVKEEAEINRTRVKSSLYLERSTKPTGYSGEALLLRSQSARLESSVGESSKEEHESVSVSPTRKKSIKIQPKAVVTPRWAWAFNSSGLHVSDMVMEAHSGEQNRRGPSLLELKF